MGHRLIGGGACLFNVNLTMPYRLFDVGGIIAIAGMGLALTFAVARNTRDLYRAEPLPR